MRPRKRPRRGSPLPKLISKDDIANMIGCIGKLKQRAMLLLLDSSGRRRSQWLDMRIANIDSKRNVVQIRWAENDKDRPVPRSPKVLALLREGFKQFYPLRWLFECEKPNTPYAAPSLHKVFPAATYTHRPHFGLFAVIGNIEGESKHIEGRK